jgi:hypothetical protein
MAIQDAWDAALHVHSRATTIVIDPVPPDGPTGVDVPVTTAGHRVVDAGLVTLVRLVDVEPPHAIDPRTVASAAIRTE